MSNETNQTFCAKSDGTTSRCSRTGVRTPCTREVKPSTSRASLLLVSHGFKTTPEHLRQTSMSVRFQMTLRSVAVDNSVDLRPPSDAKLMPLGTGTER